MRKVRQVEERVGMDIKDYLEQEYIQGRKSVHQIGKNVGVGGITIHRWLEKFDIKSRSVQEACKIIGQDRAEKKKVSYPSQEVECPVCRKILANIESRNRHLSQSKNIEHRTFVQQQINILEQYHITGRTMADLLANKDFVFGQWWAWQYSKKSLKTPWTGQSYGRTINKRQYTCVECGEDFEGYESTRGEALYCSYECANKSKYSTEIKVLDIIDEILSEKSSRNKFYSWLRSPKDRPYK